MRFVDWVLGSVKQIAKVVALQPVQQSVTIFLVRTGENALSPGTYSLCDRKLTAVGRQQACAAGLQIRRSIGDGVDVVVLAEPRGTFGLPVCYEETAGIIGETLGVSVTVSQLKPPPSEFELAAFSRFGVPIVMVLNGTSSSRFAHAAPWPKRKDWAARTRLRVCSSAQRDLPSWRVQLAGLGLVALRLRIPASAPTPVTTMVP
jgi:hypothetical protein